MTEGANKIKMSRILGHSVNNAGFPKNEKVDGWLKSTLKRCIESISECNILFIDILFIHADEKTFTGAIYSKAPDIYMEKVIFGLFDQVCSVALLDDFIEGLLEDDEDRFLFYNTDKIISHPDTSPSNGNSSEYKLIRFDSEDAYVEYVNKKKKNSETVQFNSFEGWRKKAKNGKSIDLAWSGYTELINNNYNYDFCLVGIPVVIPNYGSRENDSRKNLLVGSLFFAIQKDDAKEESSLLEKVGLVVKTLVPLMLRGYAIQAVQGYAEQYAEKKEMVKSHRLLMHLQRPLDALMDAFDSVQSEAQEMNAILNAPEVGLFKAHKRLAPIFQEGQEIVVSDAITIKGKHAGDHRELENAQGLFCYAICSIFGVEKLLKTAQSHTNLVSLAWEALRNVRRLGIYKDFMDLLGKMLFEKIPKNMAFEDIVYQWNIIGEEDFIESNQNTITRFNYAKMVLKAVCFTPFKDYEGKWFVAPVLLAAFGEKLNNDDLRHRWINNNTDLIFTTKKAEDSPFAQHAILNFIIGVKEELRSKDVNYKINELQIYVYNNSSNKKVLNGASRRISNITEVDENGPDLVEYRLEMNNEFFVSSGDEGAINLARCLKAAARFGVTGRNLGSFFGIFQDLMRHGIGISSDTDSEKSFVGDWVLLPRPGCVEGVQVLMLLGRKARNIEDMTCKNKSENESEYDSNKCEICCHFDKFFSIVQEKTGIDKFFLRIIFSNDSGYCFKIQSGSMNDSRRSAVSNQTNISTTLKITPNTVEEEKNGERGKKIAGEAAVPVEFCEAPTDVKIVVIDKDDAGRPWANEIRRTISVRMEDWSSYFNNRIEEELKNLDGKVILIWHPNWNKVDKNNSMIKIFEIDKVIRVVVVTREGNLETFNRNPFNNLFIGKFKKGVIEVDPGTHEEKVVVPEDIQHCDYGSLVKRLLFMEE